jgi:hypothetical protein
MLLDVENLLNTLNNKLEFCFTKSRNHKFNKDLRNKESLQLSSTRRFIPLAINQCGRKGPYFEAILREHASLMIKRSSGCCLLHGPFFVPPTIALAKVLSTWGARLTWAAQRKHAAQIIKALKIHKATNAFLSSIIGHGYNRPRGQGYNQAYNRERVLVEVHHGRWDGSRDEGWAGSLDTNQTCGLRKRGLES